MPKLRVLLNPSLSGKLSFLVIQVLRQFAHGHVDRHKSRGSESIPCSLECWSNKGFSPHTALPSMSLITGWEKGPGPYSDHALQKLWPQLVQGTVQVHLLLHFQSSNSRVQECRQWTGVCLAQCEGTGHLQPIFLAPCMTPNSLRTSMKIIKLFHMASRLLVVTPMVPSRFISRAPVSCGSNPRRPFFCLLQAFLHDLSDS